MTDVETKRSRLPGWVVIASMALFVGVFTLILLWMSGEL